jgi:hypothetical protein
MQENVDGNGYSYSCHVHSSIVTVLVSRSPESLLIPDSGGSLPLHCAVGHEVCSETVKFLVDQAPAALSVSNSDGALPLHVAVAHKQSYQWQQSPQIVVRLLVERAPASVRARNLAGSLPLHIAVARHDASLETVMVLVETWLFSMQVTDSQGFQAAHLAAVNGAPLSVVFYLVSKFPTTVYRRRGRSSNDAS